MQKLVERIQNEGVYVGGGIIKIDSFLNHQIDARLMEEIGAAFAQQFTEIGVNGVTKIVTAESSGIPPALATGMALGVPVIYARKKPPLTMSKEIYYAEAPSRTKGDVVPLMISPDFLGAADRVLIIDDFLATGLTAVAVVDLVRQSGATLCGIGCVVEKVFEPGRERLATTFSGPVITLAKIDLQGDSLRVFE